MCLKKMNSENSAATYAFVACCSFSTVVVTHNTSHNSQKHTKSDIDSDSTVKDRESVGYQEITG